MKAPHSPKFFAIPAVIILAVSIVAYKPISENDRYFQIAKNIDIFVTLFKEINEFYVDEINPNEVIKVGIDAMLAYLDPYTNYIPEDDIEAFMTMTTGEYGGIGALIDRKEGVNTVILTYENSPAQKAGLKIGDQIISVNGTEIQDKSSDQIGILLKGQANSETKLTIKRYGIKEPFVISLVREKITISNVPYFGIVKDEVGYIRLTDFTSNASREVANALKKLKSEGAKRIILDLRGNPGGLLDEAINVSNIFIGKGVEVVSTKGKLDSWTQVYKTQQEALDKNIPLAVLIDQGSASASEIVAGVIQDYDRGVVIGNKSFGKGLVQQTRPLAYNSQLKVTTAKYYIPSGRCIQAINYSKDQNKQSSDSLANVFKTKAGRLVFDGGGIDPDIFVDRYIYSEFVRALLEQNIFFHFATAYYYENPGDISPKDFEISQEVYQEFIEFSKLRKFSYNSKIERDIESITTQIRDNSNAQRKKLNELIELIELEKNNDFEKYRKEVEILLKQEIASRYYLHKGIVESTFSVDQDINKAVEILSDTSKYSQILVPK